MWRITKNNDESLRADTGTCLIAYLNTLNNKGKLDEVVSIERVCEVRSNESTRCMD